MTVHRQPRKRRHLIAAGVTLAGVAALPLLLGNAAQAAVDRTAPKVVSTNPANGATDVSTSVVITLDFSEAMSKTLPIALLTQGNKSVKVTTKWDDSDTLSLTPAAALLAGTSYATTVYGAQDLAKNSAAIKMFSFKTVAVVTPPTTTPPTTAPPTTAPPTTDPTTAPPTTLPPTTTPPTTTPPTTDPTTAPPTTVPPTTTPPTTAPPTTLPPTTPARAELITNGTVEAGTDTPTGWTPIVWGSAVGTSSWSGTSANGGVKGLGINLSSVGMAGGAGEWVSDKIPVTAGKTYTFADSYKSDQGTQIGADLYDASGARLSFVYIGSVDPSIQNTAQGTDGTASTGADLFQWNKTNLGVTIPTGGAFIQVYHYLPVQGFLYTDNYSFTEGYPVVVPAPVGAELVPNASAEVGTDATGWYSGGWGVNTPTFTVPATGAHSGSKSLRVDMTGFSTGSASWGWARANVVGGQFYSFSDWYKSSVNTTVVVGYAGPDGVLAWSTLSQAVAPASVWTQYKSGLMMPAGATTAYFVHAITGNGYLQTDDYSMQRTGTPIGYNRALITLTFDDGSQSNYESAVQLDGYTNAANPTGFKSTQYVPTEDYNQADEPEFWSKTELQYVANHGHEIAGHSVTHPDLSCNSTFTVTQAQKGTAVDPCIGSPEHKLTLAQEVTQNKTTLDGALPTGMAKTTSFATPFGGYNSDVITALKTAGWGNHRSVEAGYNTPTTMDRWDIKVQNMTNTTTAAEFQGWVDTAIANKFWLVIVYHEVLATPTGDVGTDTYSTTPALFKAQLDYVKSTGIKVSTIKEALAEVIPQAK